MPQLPRVHKTAHHEETTYRCLFPSEGVHVISSFRPPTEELSNYEIFVAQERDVLFVNISNDLVVHDS